MRIQGFRTLGSTRTTIFFFFFFLGGGVGLGYFNHRSGFSIIIVDPRKPQAPKR